MQEDPSFKRRLINQLTSNFIQQWALTKRHVVNGFCRHQTPGGHPKWTNRLFSASSHVGEHFEPDVNPAQFLLVASHVFYSRKACSAKKRFNGKATSSMHGNNRLNLLVQYWRTPCVNPICHLPSKIRYK